MLSPHDRAYCEHGLGVLDDLRGDLPSAEKHLRGALAGWNSLGEGAAALRVKTLLSLGEVLSRRQRYGDALDIFTRAAAEARELLPLDAGLYPQALSRLGLLRGELDQPDIARPLLLEAIATFDAAPVADRPEIAYASNSLASLEIRTGLYTQAETHARRAVDLATASLGEEHPETAAYQTSLALSLIGQGQYSRAELLLRRARFIVEKRLGPAHAQLGTILIELSAVQMVSRRLAAADESARLALAIVERDSGPSSLAAALAKVNLAGVLMAEKKITEARAVLPGAIETERRLLPGGRMLADGIRRLADLCAAEHKWGDAQLLYREALAVYEASVGSAHPDIAPVLLAWADTLRRQNAPHAEVRSVEARARALRRPSSRG